MIRSSARPRFGYDDIAGLTSSFVVTTRYPIASSGADGRVAGARGSEGDAQHLAFLRMDAAIASLAGVVVGGSLTIAHTEFAQRRKDRREARAVGRLLARELTSARDAIQGWLQSGRLAEPSREDAFRFPAWKLYHEGAARALKPPAWDKVSDAYMAIYKIRTAPQVATLDERTAESLRSAEELTRAAIDALRATI